MVSQNTAEWLEVRKRHIGSSDAPTIMGVSPWKTPYQLWEEKLDLAVKTPQNPAMQRGLALEEKARQQLEEMTGLFFLPQVKFHRTFSWMMASLDAIDPENKYIAEIKCPNKEDHTSALAQKVPEKYFPQIQHQLEVCELEMGYYFSFDGTSGVLVKVYRDEKYIKKMLQKEEEFFECMQDFVPPELVARDYVHQEGDLWGAAASQWMDINEELKNLEKKEKQLRETLVSMAQKMNSVGAGIKLTRFVKRGSVDYTSVPELQQVDLEKYRKSPVECYKISRV